MSDRAPGAPTAAPYDENGLSPRAQELLDLIAEAEDALIWMAREDAAECTTPLEKQRALERLADLAVRQGSVAADAYLKDFAKIFSVSTGAIRKLFSDCEARLTKCEDSPQSGDAGASSGAALTDPLRDACERFNQNHFVTWFGGSVYVGRETKDEDGRDTVVFASYGDFTRYYCNFRLPVVHEDGSTKVKEVAKEWLDGPRRTFERVVFRPNKPPSPNEYNLWRGFGVVPKAGACALYKAHLEEVICSRDSEMSSYVWRWMAHSVQRPDELPEVALILRGGQGTGKGTFAKWLLKIFGSHGLTVHSMDYVAGRFNAHLKDVVLLFADEAFWGPRDKSHEGLIKALITEPKRLVEPKNKDATQVDSFTRLIVATNTDHPVSMDWDDRRMVVLDVADTRKGDAPYFAALDREMISGGVEALMHELLHEDLSGWHPRQKPRRGNDFDIKLRSSGAAAQWWFEILASGVNRATEDESTVGEPREWDETPTVQDLHKLYRRWCEDHKKRFVDQPQVFGMELRRMAPHLRVWRPPLKSDVAGSGWQTGRRRYVLGSLDLCRSAFETFARVGPGVWDEGADSYQEEF